jgi:excinuclease ABC subunit A
MDDVKRLLVVLHKLVNAGNTLVVVEHNLDVIKSADWIIDLGPEGGDGGGSVAARGTPAEVARVRSGSHTALFLAGFLRDRSSTAPRAKRVIPDATAPRASRARRTRTARTAP